MPKFTARVLVKRGTIIQEEIWLEEIRATDQRIAQNKVAGKMNNYLQQHSDADDPPNGYTVVFCILSEMLDGATQLPLGQEEATEKQALMLPEATKQKVKVVHMKFNEKKFKEEIKGDFNDPFKFKEAVSLKVITSYYNSSYRSDIY